MFALMGVSPLCSSPLFTKRLYKREKKKRAGRKRDILVHPVEQFPTFHTKFPSPSFGTTLGLLISFGHTVFASSPLVALIWYQTSFDVAIERALDESAK